MSTGSALGFAELPPVDYNRSVSAMELYGVPKVSGIREQVSGTKDQGLGTNEVLIPRKPSESLWANNEAPLRMPEKSEYKKYAADEFELPEENLDNLFAAVSVRAVDRDRSARDQSGPRNNAVKSVGSRVKKAGVGASSGGNSAAVPTNAADNETTRRSAPASRRAPGVIRSAPKFAPAPKKSVMPAAPKVEAEEEIEYKNQDEVPLTKLSPSGLKKAFKRTFSVENKHLSTYQIEDGFDEVATDDSQGEFDSARDLSEQSGGVRPLEIKIGFYDDDSALSRDNYNLLAEYAGIVSANPKRAVQISISERSTRSYDGRKLAARRLAIIEQVLKDSGIVDRRIIPVLSQRSDDSIVLRVISSDTFQTLTEKKRDMFGDTVGNKSVKSLQW
jgi:hypothetical protein